MSHVYVLLILAIWSPVHISSASVYILTLTDDSPSDSRVRQSNIPRNLPSDSRVRQSNTLKNPSLWKAKTVDDNDTLGEIENILSGQQLLEKFHTPEISRRPNEERIRDESYQLEEEINKPDKSRQQNEERIQNKNHLLRKITTPDLSRQNNDENKDTIRQRIDESHNSLFQKTIPSAESIQQEPQTTSSLSHSIRDEILRLVSSMLSHLSHLLAQLTGSYDATLQIVPIDTQPPAFDVGQTPASDVGQPLASDVGQSLASDVAQPSLASGKPVLDRLDRRDLGMHVEKPKTAPAQSEQGPKKSRKKGGLTTKDNEPDPGDFF